MKKNFQQRYSKKNDKSLIWNSCNNDTIQEEYWYSEDTSPKNIFSGIATLYDFFVNFKAPFTKKEPFIKNFNGCKGIYLKGKLHNEFGPALYIGESEYFFLDGVNYTRKEYLCKLRPLKMAKFNF